MSCNHMQRDTVQYVYSAWESGLVCLAPGALAGTYGMMYVCIG